MGFASPCSPTPPPTSTRHTVGACKVSLTQTHRSRKHPLLECMFHLGLAEGGARGPRAGGLLFPYFWKVPSSLYLPYPTPWSNFGEHRGPVVQPAPFLNERMAWCRVLRPFPE